MVRFRPQWEKRASDGTVVLLLLDPWDAWFVGRAGERFPMGAFMREEGARAYADQEFPGGSWRPIAAPRAPGRVVPAPAH